MIVDWSSIERQRADDELRRRLAEDPSYLQRRVRRELKHAEKARLRGTPHVDGDGGPGYERTLEEEIVASKVALVAAATGGDD